MSDGIERQIIELNFTVREFCDHEGLAGGKHACRTVFAGLLHAFDGDVVQAGVAAEVGLEVAEDAVGELTE